MTTSVTSGLTKEQLEARKLGIGGSDAAAVLGINPYRTALELYELKLGLREPDPPNAAMKRGIVLESIARKLYGELTGRRVRRLRQQTHHDYPFMLCNVDGEIAGGKRGRGVLEMKCPGIWAFAKAKREGLPLHWIVQLQHNLEVTGYQWGSFALFNSDLWEMIHFDVERDDDLARALVVKESQFWNEHVLAKVPPPPEVQNTTPELMAQLARAQGAVGGGELLVRNDPEWGTAAEMYREAREIEETAENLMAAAKEKLKGLMGEKGAIEGGGIRVYWSERDGKKSFDRKTLEATKPLERFAVAAAINSRVMGDDMKTAVLADLANCAVDFAAFEKVGKPYEDFRVYPLRSVGVGD